MKGWLGDIASGFYLFGPSSLTSVVYSFKPCTYPVITFPGLKCMAGCLKGGFNYYSVCQRLFHCITAMSARLFSRKSLFNLFSWRLKTKTLVSSTSPLCYYNVGILIKSNFYLIKCSATKRLVWTTITDFSRSTQVEVKASQRSKFENFEMS